MFMVKRGGTAVEDLQSEIWRMQLQSDIAGLLNLLRHKSANVRARAALALQVMGANAAIPSLQMALMDETDPSTRRLFIAVLDDLFQLALENDAELPPYQHHPIVSLIDQLSGQSHEQIIRAAQQIGERGAKIAAETLVRVFENTELPSRVRLTAAEALLKLDCAPVEVSLLAALRHPEFQVRRSAAGVLGQLKAAWAVDALIAVLTDPHDSVRRMAQAALQRIGTPEALAAAGSSEPSFPPPPALHVPPMEEEDTRPAPPLPDDVS
jgi:HEAT repeat protein